MLMMQIKYHMTKEYVDLMIDQTEELLNFEKRKDIELYKQTKEEKEYCYKNLNVLTR